LLCLHLQIFLIWVPWRWHPGAETCRNLVRFLVVICVFVCRCNYWSVDGCPPQSPVFNAWWYRVRWLVDEIVLECCRDQLTCQLNSRTMHTAAVGMAWSLLGSLRNHQIALYIFQMCCVISIPFSFRLKIICFPCSIITYHISYTLSFQMQWKLLRYVWLFLKRRVKTSWCVHSFPFFASSLRAPTPTK